MMRPIRVSPGIILGPTWVAGLAGLQEGANQRGRSFRILRPQPIRITVFGVTGAGPSRRMVKLVLARAVAPGPD